MWKAMFNLALAVPEIGRVELLGRDVRERAYLRESRLSGESPPYDAWC